MTYFHLPDTLLNLSMICLIAVSAGVFFFLLFFSIWSYRKKKKKSAGNLLPRLSTLVSSMGLLAVVASLTYGTYHNTETMMQTISDTYHVKVLAMDGNELTIVKDTKVQNCEIRTFDDISHVVQCEIPGQGWLNLETIQ